MVLLQGAQVVLGEAVVVVQVEQLLPQVLQMVLLLVVANVVEMVGLPMLVVLLEHQFIMQVGVEVVQDALAQILIITD
jgi:phage-related protein